tara:strand:+ start:85 stop:1524 length:1440 start_codon:yes stop_codon:yes gene_type:complete
MKKQVIFCPLHSLFLSKMKKINKSYTLLFILIVAILPYCYLCFFANPISDDFSLATQVQQNDFFEIVYEQYFIRNGRYVSSSLSFLNPIGFNSFFGYKLMSLLLIVVTFLSALFFINQLLYFRSKVFKVTTSLILFLMFFQNMPIISEGIYWYTGSVIYTLGTFVFLFYSGFFIKFLRKELEGYRLALLTFLLFISCGFNEVLTLLIVFVLGVVTFVCFQKDFKLKKVVLWQFIFACLFAAILIVAPGNAVRGNSYSESHRFLYSLSYSIMQVGRFTALWIASIPLIAASLLYYFLNKNLALENQLFKDSFYLNRRTSLFLLFSIIFICVFPAYWATGLLGQHRTLNVAYFFFIIMWFINLTVWYNYYYHRVKINVRENVKVYLIIGLLVGLCFTGNGYNALEDIFEGTASSFNKEHQDRFKTLSGAKGSNVKYLFLLPIKSKPKCLFVSDITNDSKHWINQAYNMYFRVDSLDIYLSK